METNINSPSSVSKGMYSLLAREINWMETTKPFFKYYSNYFSLYSLEKLIEWKQVYGYSTRNESSTLYSLEKLIEWKLSNNSTYILHIQYSLLAREINWMETLRIETLTGILTVSLLAREINWMETVIRNWGVFHQDCSLLAREINWMETLILRESLDLPINSLLAREINWMETSLEDQRRTLLLNLSTR